MRKKERIAIVGYHDLWKVRLKRIIEDEGHEVVAFIDSYASGFFEGVPIVHPAKAKEVLGDGVVYAFTFPIVGYRKAVLDLLHEQYGRDLLYYDYRQTYQRWKKVFPIVEDEGYWLVAK